jgi:hypothetical protein
MSRFQHVAHRIPTARGRSSLDETSLRARWFAVFCVGAAALAFGAPAHAVVCCLPDLENGFDPPDGNPNAYELDFLGDVKSLIPDQVTDDPLINPFAALHRMDSTAALNPTTVEYDAGANLTRVILSGHALPDPVPAGFPGPHYRMNGVDTYHTGMNAGDVHNKAVVLVSRHWNYEDGALRKLDAPTLSWSGDVTRKTKTLRWLATFIRTVDPATRHPQAGAWRLTAYDPASRKPFTITNHSAEPLMVDTIGYLPDIEGSTDPECRQSPTCEANKEMLDSLSAEAFPPPHDPGSRFIKAKIPRNVIPPNGSFSFKIR